MVRARHPFIARTLASACALLLALPARPALPAPDCDGIDPQRIQQRLNALRERGGWCGERGAFAPTLPLHWHERLQQAAQGHAAWVAQQGALDHFGEDGRTVGQRARQAGYSWRRVAENLAAGQRSFDRALSDWSLSPSHCAALFDGRVSELGLACVRGARGVPYWVLVLAQPR